MSTRRKGLETQEVVMPFDPLHPEDFLPPEVVPQMTTIQNSGQAYKSPNPSPQQPIEEFGHFFPEDLSLPAPSSRQDLPSATICAATAEEIEAALPVIIGSPMPPQPEQAPHSIDELFTAIPLQGADGSQPLKFGSDPGSTPIPNIASATTQELVLEQSTLTIWAKIKNLWKGLRRKN